MRTHETVLIIAWLNEQAIATWESVVTPRVAEGLQIIRHSETVSYIVREVVHVLNSGYAGGDAWQQPQVHLFVSVV